MFVHIYVSIFFKYSSKMAYVRDNWHTEELEVPTEDYVWIIKIDVMESILLRYFMISNIHPT